MYPVVLPAGHHLVPPCSDFICCCLGWWEMFISLMLLLVRDRCYLLPPVRRIPNQEQSLSCWLQTVGNSLYSLSHLAFSVHECLSVAETVHWLTNWSGTLVAFEKMLLVYDLAVLHYFDIKTQYLKNVHIAGSLIACLLNLSPTVYFWLTLLIHTFYFK